VAQDEERQQRPPLAPRQLVLDPPPVALDDDRAADLDAEAGL
jgi:hypothetical protein